VNYCFFVFDPPAFGQGAEPDFCFCVNPGRPASWFRQGRAGSGPASYEPGDLEDLLDAAEEDRARVEGEAAELLAAAQVQPARAAEAPTPQDRASGAAPSESPGGAALVGRLAQDPSVVSVAAVASPTRSDNGEGTTVRGAATPSEAVQTAKALALPPAQKQRARKGRSTLPDAALGQGGDCRRRRCAGECAS